MLKKRYQQSKINFSNPFKGRRWLKILKTDKDLGLLLNSSCNLNSRSDLGFTFQVNKYGFHGGGHPNSDNVILGTSFGMGFGVDEGMNWFQLDKEFERSYFNLSMPVSPGNHLAALQKLYKGNYHTLIYVYHPNVWKIASGFYRARDSKKNIFEFLGWEVSIRSMFYKIPRHVLRLCYSYANRILFKYKINGEAYLANVNYNRYNVNSPEFQTSIIDLVKIFKKFKEVRVYRIPIKEQIIGGRITSRKLSSLNLNYDECWNRFLDNQDVQSMKNVSIFDLCKDSCSSLEFELSDYLPNDTHWSPSGNDKFYKIVSSTLHKKKDEIKF